MNAMGLLILSKQAAKALSFILLAFITCLMMVVMDYNLKLKQKMSFRVNNTPLSIARNNSHPVKRIRKNNNSTSVVNHEVLRQQVFHIEVNSQAI